MVFDPGWQINTDSDPKKTITRILEDIGEATTEEIIEEAFKISNQCKDRIPGTLKSLEKMLLFLLLGFCRFWKIYSRAHCPSDSVNGKRRVDTTEIGRHEHE